MGYKLFLDDTRDPKNRNWKVVRNYAEFVKCIIDIGLPSMVSFDHDLGDIVDGKELTGYDCAKWLVEHCIDNDVDLPNFKVHSANPVGVQNITAYLKNYKAHRVKDIRALRERVRNAGQIGGEMIDDVWVPTLNGEPITDEERNKILDDLARYKRMFLT